jgi:hypothetical protein
MGKAPLTLVPVFFLAASQISLECASAQPALPGAMRIGESKPVTVNGAQFVAVAQTEWQPPKPSKNVPMVAPLEVHLRITNLSKSDLALPTYQTFGLKLYDADGKEVKTRNERDGKAATAPVVLSPGGSYTLWRRAELRWDENGKAIELLYFDGTGSEAVIGPLMPGRYKLVFWYKVPAEKEAMPKIGETAKWVGDAVTQELFIDILEGTTQGRVNDVGKFLDAGGEIRVIRESKPVTIKDAEFAIMAQNQWKAAKETIPIEAQLRITNLSKGAMLFHTFDAFGVIIKDADGKQIKARGGRRVTIFTRPVLLSQGASYSLCRKAELRWNLEAKAHDLFYWDGTGWEHTFGPLVPGRYNLSFWYAIGPDQPFRGAWEKQHQKAGDAPAWVGQAVTQELTIELRTP